MYLSEGECGGDYVRGWRIVGLAYNLMVYLLVETGGGLESTDDYLSVKRSKRYKVEDELDKIDRDCIRELRLGTKSR